MSFIEPWSNKTKISSSAFEPYNLSENDLDEGLDWDDLDELENTDPNTKPDVSIYEPITFEEILESPIGYAGEVDWSDFKPTIKQRCIDFIGLWVKDIQDDFETSPVLSDEINETLLKNLKQLLVSHLSTFAEITDFCAWLSEAYERLEVMQNKRDIAMMAKLFPDSWAQKELKLKIDELSKEIEDFENEWEILEKIYEYEEFLLDTYVNTVVAAQKRIDKYREKKLSIGIFGPKPESRQIKNSYDFEHYCRDWLVYLGVRNALVSSKTQDGGADIISDEYVAQVKLYNGPIPVSQIRDLLGTSIDFGKKPIFFASMSYSKGSIEFADRNDIPLIIVDAYNGKITGGNVHGSRLIQSGARQG
ncbi:MAG: hypothetical protein RLZ82_96 [Actinomycetota bacterium]|jgi:HJR/Mrr/RecB family endonuclease